MHLCLSKLVVWASVELPRWHFPPFWPQLQVLVFSNPPCLAGYMYQMMPSMGFYGSVGVQSTQFRALMTALRTGSRAGTNPCWTGMQTTSQDQLDQLRGALQAAGRDFMCTRDLCLFFEYFRRFSCLKL